MERELIDEDPLSPSFFGVCRNYKTTKHKLKLCTPPLPIHKYGDFIFLGSKELLDTNVGDDFRSYTSTDTFDYSVEVYSKREWMINWCEEKMKNGFGWYLLNDIAPLLLRELKSGNSYFHFFDLVKEYEIESLNSILKLYDSSPEISYKSSIDDSDIDAETVKQLEYTGSSNLSENVLIKNSTKVRKAIFGDLLVNGKVVILHHPKDRLELIEEVEYYGSGIQAGPLAGSGGIHFEYKNKGIYYRKTWIS